MKRALTMVGVVAVALLLGAQPGGAQVVTGTIDDWQETGPVMAFGDGVHDVHAWWSINTYDRGWFYGNMFTGDSDVAHATGVTKIGDLADASIFTYTDDSIGPLCDADCDPDGVGEFVLWRNMAGYYGALRIDDIKTTTGPVASEPPLSRAVPRLAPLNYWLDGTWWFQSNGTPDLRGCTMELAASYDPSGTLTLDFEVGNTYPATWNFWLTVGNEIYSLWSLGLPVVDPAISLSYPIPGFPQIGRVGFLSTLVTPNGIECGTFRTVDTGLASPGPARDELLRRFPGLEARE